MSASSHGGAREDGRHKWRFLAALAICVLALQCLDLYLSTSGPSHAARDQQQTQQLRIRSAP